FSAANWGDRQERDGPSGIKNVDLTSDIVRAVAELSPKQRDRIKKAVVDYLSRQTRASSKRSGVVAEPTRAAPPVRRFKLRDQDSDSDATDSDEGGSQSDSSPTTGGTGSAQAEGVAQEEASSSGVEDHGNDESDTQH
ncbi:hypothetical protein H0H92_015195, partial [Tricholoma furcatifolium]